MSLILSNFKQALLTGQPYTSLTVDTPEDGVFVALLSPDCVIDAGSESDFEFRYHLGSSVICTPQRLVAPTVEGRVFRCASRLAFEDTPVALVGSLVLYRNNPLDQTMSRLVSVIDSESLPFLPILLNGCALDLYFPDEGSIFDL